MKKYICLPVFIAMMACNKKDVSLLSPQSESSIRDEVLNMTSHTQLTDLSYDKNVELIRYLDHASGQEVNAIFEKMKSLNRSKKLAIEEKLAKSQEPGALSSDELNSLVDNDPYEPHHADRIDDVYVSGPGWGEFGPDVNYRYVWTMAYSILYIYSIQSSDLFELQNMGSSLPINSRYQIRALSHVTSYIEGFSPGLTWQDTGSEHIKGLYFAHLRTFGMLSQMGINIPKEGKRYVNAGVVYGTNGAQLNQ